MSRRGPVFFLLTIVTILTTLNTGALAQRPYRVTDRQVETVLRRLETNANTFRTNLARSLDRSSFNNTTREDEINRYVSEFQVATDHLRDRLTNRTSSSVDVQDVLTRGQSIDRFLRANRLDTVTERNWQTVRTDLQTLAGYYNVPVNWNSGGYNSDNNNSGYNSGGNNRGGSNRGGYNTGRLEGTFTLDATRSDDTRVIAERYTRGLSTQEAERVRRIIDRRLESPNEIALNVQGRRVTMASTNAPQVSFDADGRPQTETQANGRTTRTTATLTGNNRLLINSTGDRGSDYSVTFDAIDGGRSMRVTRQYYTERLSQPISVQSTYNRTSEVARFDMYNERPGNGDNRNDNRNNDRASGTFNVPNGMRLTAVLDANLNTEQVREGDRFTMTVRSPSQYEGATIEGHVNKVDRSGRLAGRSELGLDFDSIRLRNGTTYSFDAFIDAVRKPNGDKIDVDNEGSVREDSTQTQRTVTRAGIGAAIGAIIGGIAGGGSGAAIGAGVGAGAGTGSVLLQGRDDVNLISGTEFTLSSNTPRNSASSR